MKRKLCITATVIAILAIAMFSILSVYDRRSSGVILNYDELTGLPIQTLTIRASNRYRWIIPQAVEAVNDAWQKRGEPYIFHVEIDEYPFFDRSIREHIPFDFEARDARLTRLRLELMAGQGPDMFIFDGFYDLHAFVNSGLFQNIYMLMDADPDTNKSDFFTNVLSAFEINNGLYVLPASFGFEYVAVNASLPQEFIDRFALKSAISFSEMMDFYLDLMNTYGEEFRHLNFDVVNGLTRPMTMVLASIDEYVDFSARTSNLTDASFIEFLEQLGAAHADTNYWGGSVHMPFIGHCRLRELAYQNVFWIEGWDFSAELFGFNPPPFKHSIPLVDDNNRFILNYNPIFGRQTTWAYISIANNNNGALAWEFAKHLIYAFTNPVGLATLDPIILNQAPWNTYYAATPILRSLFKDYTLPRFQSIVSADDNLHRIQQSKNIIDHMVIYNEQPMNTLLFRIPHQLIEEPLYHFSRGLITAETAAQRMQNAVSLWLIE